MTFAVSGRNPEQDATKIGIFDLAACQAQGGVVDKTVLLELTAPRSGKDVDFAGRVGTATTRLVDAARTAASNGYEIHFACFSWGSTLCLRAAQELYNGGVNSVQVEKIVLLDRVTLLYPGGLRPENDPNTHLPLVTPNVTKVYAVYQELFSCDPPTTQLCGGPVTPSHSDQLEQIVLNRDPSNIKGERLLELVLDEFHKTYGRDPVGNEIHTFIDDSKELRVMSGEFLGQPCAGFDSQCGNGIREFGEYCDGGDDSLCVGQCNPPGHTRECLCAECGNGVPDIGEQCDGTNLSAQTCETLGFAGGNLGCDDTCTFDTSNCEACGNNRLEPGEDCDGSDDSACPGQCISAGQPNQCQCQAPNLSGTWSICVTAWTGPGNITETSCELCDPENLGCITRPYPILGNPTPWCFSGPFAVAQNGSFLSHSRTATCWWGSDSCEDTLTGSVSGTSVSFVFDRRIVNVFNPDPINNYQRQTYNINATVTSATQLYGLADPFLLESHGVAACSTNDIVGTHPPGTVQITISP
jgi:hypothetical protein